MWKILKKCIGLQIPFCWFKPCCNDNSQTKHWNAMASWRLCTVYNNYEVIYLRQQCFDVPCASMQQLLLLWVRKFATWSSATISVGYGSVLLGWPVSIQFTMVTKIHTCVKISYTEGCKIAYLHFKLLLHAFPHQPTAGTIPCVSNVMSFCGEKYLW